MQKKNGPLAFNGNVSRDLNKVLIFVVFGVKLLLKNFKTERKVGVNTDVFKTKHSSHVGGNVIKMQLQLPLKAAMIGEDEVALASRSCAASEFFCGHPSPDTRQKHSGITAVYIQK